MAFDAGRVTASLDLDRSPFTRSLAEARRSAANFARQTYEASLGVRGSAETITELKGVDKAADKLDGRDIDLDVDKDGSAGASLGSLSGGFKSLAGNIRATGTVLAASTIPFAIAGIGAATPSILALGASLGGLALNLGKAAAGFGLVAAAAGGGALVGLKAYTSLITSTVSATRAAWEEQNKKTTEEVKAIRSQILLTRAANDFNEEINQQIIGFSHLQAAVGSAVFPAFTREMQAWSPIIKEFTPLIASTAGTIARVATGFTKWFRTAEDGKVLREVVEFLSQSAIKAAGALSSVAQIGISAFRPLIPLASNLQDEVLGILDATNSWVQSAQGQRRLGQVYRSLLAEAKRLAPVLLDLFHGTVNLFDALDRSGIATQASRGFASLADAYERATRTGGGLDSFLRSARQLMPFVAEAAGKVGGAIGNIAQAIIGVGDKSGRLTTLQRIFQGIGNAAKPLQRLVVGTFRDLGPEIAKLIPQAARFLSVFAGSSGPLVTFVRVIRRALQIFNDLPSPIKKAAVNLAALKLVLGGLGVGAVVGPMGRFASNMLLARGAAAKLAGKSALLGVAGGLAKIGLVLAGGIGLGVLAAAFYLVYKRNKQVHDAVDRLVTKLKDGLSPQIKRAQDLWKDFGKGVADRIDRLGRLIVNIFDLNDKKGKLQQYGRNATANFGLGVRQQSKNYDKDGGPGFEAGRALGRGIGKGLHNYLVNKGGGAGGLPGLSAVQWITLITPSGMLNRVAIWTSHTFGGGIIRGIRDKINWTDIGRLFLRFVTNVVGLGGLSRVIGRQLEEHIGKPFRQWISNFGWGKQGEHAADGFLAGFARSVLPDGLINILKKAREGVKNWQQERSPAKLWMVQGKNAALGYLEGFKGVKLGDGIRRELQDGIVTLGDVPRSVWDRLLKNGWKGDPRDSAERLYAPMRSMSANDRARQIFSGGRPTGAEVRFLKAHADQISDSLREGNERFFRRFAETFRRFGYHSLATDRPNGPGSDRWSARNQNMVRAEDGSMVPRSFYNKTDYRPVKAAIDEDGMRRVMREHRSEVQRAARTSGGGDGVSVEQAAMHFIAALEQALPGFIDRSLGGYFQHRNNMGPDPR